MAASTTAKLFGGKTLTGGSAKQQAWAEEIRAKKLALIDSEEDAIALCDPRSLARGALFWIHNRHRQPHEFAEFINETRRLREAAESLQDKAASGKDAAKFASALAWSQEYKQIAAEYNLLTLRWGFYK